VAGLEEAHGRFATREWSALVEPAIELAREGFVRDEPRRFLHRILEGILERDDGGRSIYGDPERVRTDSFCATLERVRDAGAAAVRQLLPELAADLARYQVATRPPIEADVLGLAVQTTPEPSRGGRIVLDILELLAAGGDRSLHELARAIGLGYGAAARGPLSGTTHVSVLDATGTAAALSSTLGSGSGVFRGGTQLNNMLGELDVIGESERTPGERLPSMMTPTLVLDERRTRLVVGSAGSVRLAGAIAQVVWSATRHDRPVSEAIDAPRIHVEGSTLHIEGGWADDSVNSLPDSWEIVRWDGLNLFFGGVQAVQRARDGSLHAAGDPRRGGAGLVVP
jgi:gamma-glutamyltranspeptidase/glutathione hydrolase